MKKQEELQKTKTEHSEGMHTHVDADGNVYTHSHSHGGGDETGHTHEHCHSAEEKAHHHNHNHPNAKAVSNRLARAIGHLEKVKNMVDNGEDCAEVLIQLAAVRSAINNAGKVLLIDHMNHCIVEAVEEGDMEKIEELDEAIRKFIK